MRITFHDNFPREWQGYFRRAFELIVGRLGVADYSREVVLQLGTHRESERGYITPTYDQRARLFQGGQPLRFEVGLNPRQHPNDILASFAHELVHLKQWTLGELKVTVGWKNGRITADQTYYNIAGVKNLPYDDRPWEQEAFAQMYKLSRWVRKTIHEERQVRK
jgi:hypothetical protein